jgi:hypothetical protein
VPDVGDSGVWERGETLECGVHLCACTFEEDATTRDEERVAGKDRTTRRLGRVGHVVADRVLGVAGRCETSGRYPGVGLGQLRCPRRKRKKEKDGLDVESFADGELIVAFD